MLAYQNLEPNQFLSCLYCWPILIICYSLIYGFLYFILVNKSCFVVLKKQRRDRRNTLHLFYECWRCTICPLEGTMQPPRWQQLHKHKNELTEQSEAKLKQVNKQQLHDKYQWNKCIFLKKKYQLICQIIEFLDLNLKQILKILNWSASIIIGIVKYVWPFFLDKATWIQLPLALVYSNSSIETKLCEEAHLSLKLKFLFFFLLIHYAVNISLGYLG